MKEDEIWECTQQVWKDLTLHKIASGFVQMHGIAKNVIRHGVSNQFLGSGGEGIHCGIQNHYMPCEDGEKRGLKRIDGKIFEAPVKTRTDNNDN